jgi:Linear amide C-N hydrolases, choloylglycine hydrolase family
MASMGSANAAQTLASLQKVDGYPLYTMTYYGSYDAVHTTITRSRIDAQRRPWACSLFAALGDPRQRVFGRNFDWDFSPAVLLFTRPTNGYASVSMVDITYLGYDRHDVASLASSEQRDVLLRAPLIPFDGMNEYGLTVGMAAVPGSPGPAPDPGKPTVGSLRIIRLMLDHAQTVEEAIAVIRQYNIDFEGGPPLHYLLADPSGRAATIEWKDGSLQVIRNQQPWQVTTNFYLAGASAGIKTQDWRYRTAATWLQVAQGRIAPDEALQILAQVKQDITQWSIVYDMSTGEVRVVMGQSYNHVHTYHLAMHG